MFYKRCAWSGDLYRNCPAGVAQLVARLEIQHLRLVPGQFNLVVLGVGADDQAMANAGLVRRSAVDRDDPRAVFASDGVGGEAFAVVDVVDLDLLVLANAGQIQPLAVDGAGAFIVHYGMGHLNAVQFGFEHNAVHGGLLLKAVASGATPGVRIVVA